MSFQIQLQPSGITFAADENRPVLDSAIDANVTLPYGCRGGFCGACKGKVLQGQVDLGKAPEQSLPISEREAGFALLCCAKPQSNLLVDIKGASQTAAVVPPKQFPCRVNHLERLAGDVMRVMLQLPASETFAFRAGQYIDILLDNGLRRSFSIANAPSVKSELELHIRLIPGGHFTPTVFDGMKPRDILRVEGPFGTFWLREESLKPIVMLAGGTGFAPLKALVEHAIHLGVKRPVTLYWGARSPDGLYLHKLAQSWQSSLPHFRYIPVISESRQNDGWTGQRGLVHEAVLADFADLSQHEVYACGAPPMIEAARNSFTQQRGLPPEEFFSDAFTFAARAHS
ncbi:MAG: CDP-6-deoxy-delta-3,4-glucoseen reductase [Azoarcus sp.]|jgi:CDP-4-dehydro-6-deoxyglucose reductase|nr:CDP-6-deoxy-delta-3,4-glucoseen reductase [Azoarcus sp.]